MNLDSVERLDQSVRKKFGANRPGYKKRFCSKTFRSSFESLRTNGGADEIIGDFPFMLSPVEAFLGFFSRIKKQDLTTFPIWSRVGRDLMEGAGVLVLA